MPYTRGGAPVRRIHWVRASKPKGKPAQYVLGVNFPKWISDAYNLKGGEHAFFQIDGPDRLVIEIVRSEERLREIYSHYASLALQRHKEYQKEWYRKRKAAMKAVDPRSDHA